MADFTQAAYAKQFWEAYVSRVLAKACGVGELFLSASISGEQ
jgi:hypothetical protein